MSLKKKVSHLGVTFGLLLVALAFVALAAAVFSDAASAYQHAFSYTEGRCKIFFVDPFIPSITFTVQTRAGKSYRGYSYALTEETSNDKTADQVISNEYQVGKVYPCWYDPAKPSEAILNRNVSYWPFIYSFLFFASGVLVFCQAVQESFLERPLTRHRYSRYLPFASAEVVKNTDYTHH